MTSIWNPGTSTGGTTHVGGSIKETQTLSAAQTLVTLATFTYAIGTKSLAVFLNGLLLNAGDDYVETSTSSITLSVGAAAGDTITVDGSGDIVVVAIPGAGAIDYLPAGTGAVTTTVQSKLRESVSVLDFGAVGDGVTDDTAAIQAALNSGFPFVFMPFGTYLVSATLTIATAVITLGGASGGTQAYQTATINHSASSIGPLFRIDSSSNGGVCLRNFSVMGGNGSFCIISSRPYTRYEYIHMEPYKGGGIQLLSTGGGSSSSILTGCQWVGPVTGSNYTGYEISVTGGDVAIRHCTAVYGAIGLNIIQGQTIIVDEFSSNKQDRYGGHSTATQFNTCGIRLSGAGLKQAISIRNCYLEVCDNSIYVESCESLTIEDNWIDDGGAAGRVGAWTVYGNSAIYLADATCKNVTIKNNNIQSNSAGDVTSVATNWFAIRVNAAKSVLAVNNNISTTGDYSAQFYLTTSQTTATLYNTIVPSGSFAVANYDPNNYLQVVVTGNPPSTAWLALSYAGTWSDGGGAAYKKDAFGRVVLRGMVTGGLAGSTIATLPVGYRPGMQESYSVNASGALGLITIFTNGVISFGIGTGTYVYLSEISFSTA